VDAVYSEFSGLSAVVSPIAKQNNKPMIYSAFNKEIAENNNLSIKTYMDPEDACKNFAIYARSQNISKIAIMNEFAGVAEYCIKGANTIYSRENIILHDNIVDKDFKTILLKMQSDDVGLIMLEIYEQTATQFMKQKTELGIKIPVACGKSDCASDTVTKAVGIEAFEDSIYYEPNIKESFRHKYLEIYPSATTQDIEGAAFSYDATKRLIHSLVNCQKDDLNCIMQKIKEISSDSLDNIHFEKNSLVPSLGYSKVENASVKKLIIARG
jgi:ABC-type branched-subunit amino acid transport system substrate-binding protein